MVVGSQCKTEEWKQLAKYFVERASKRGYDLRYHNCCDAVMEALIAVNLPNVNAGIKFAREANGTWKNVFGQLTAEKFIKKNV